MLRPAENRCCDSPFSGATLRQSPVSRAKHLLRLVAEAAFRSARSWSVAGHRAGYLRELLRLLRGVRRFKPNLFRLASALALSAQSSTVYRMSSSRPSATVTGSTADCRWKSPLPRAKAVGLKISSKDIPLNLLCLTFGPLLWRAARNGCRDTDLPICLNNRIASRRPADRGEEHPGLCEGRATSGLDAFVHSLVAGLADHKPSACTGRRSGVLSLSTLNIVQFPVGGSTRHAGYRVAPRK